MFHPGEDLSCIMEVASKKAGPVLLLRKVPAFPVKALVRNGEYV